MPAKVTVATSAVQAIKTVLREVGLQHGRTEDFTVRGYSRYERDGHKSRIATRVNVLNAEADKVIAERADEIQRRTAELGYPFKVTVHWTRSHNPVTYVSGPA